jgi:hypothetical protein
LGCGLQASDHTAICLLAGPRNMLLVTPSFKASGEYV